MYQKMIYSNLRADASKVMIYMKNDIMSAVDLEDLYVDSSLTHLFEDRS